MRANGTVISRNAGRPIFAASFDSLPLYPGDTVVVPERVFTLQL